MKKRIVAGIFCLTLLCSTFSVAQPLFKVGVYENGEYTLIEDPNGTDGHRITILLLIATDDPDAIGAAEILKQSVKARKKGDAKKADSSQEEWDQRMRDIDSQNKSFIIKRPSVLSEKNLLVQLGQPPEEQH